MHSNVSRRMFSIDAVTLMKRVLPYARLILISVLEYHLLGTPSFTQFVQPNSVSPFGRALASSNQTTSGNPRGSWADGGIPRKANPATFLKGSYRLLPRASICAHFEIF